MRLSILVDENTTTLEPPVVMENADRLIPDLSPLADEERPEITHGHNERRRRVPLRHSTLRSSPKPAHAPGLNSEPVGRPDIGNESVNVR